MAASVTVPHAVLLERRGGLTDRRPGANMDPYLVSMMLVATCCGVALPTGPKVRAPLADTRRLVCLRT